MTLCANESETERWTEDKGAEEMKMLETIEREEAGGRSERSEGRPPAAAGRAADPEIPQVSKRRRHTTAYKLRILDEIDRCNRGEVGALLRREGLYHSTIIKWRAWRDKMAEQGLEPSSNSKDSKKLRSELKKLERENQRLKLKLKKTEGMVALQKKALELLEDMNQDDESSEKS
jgi:transposase-like protein